MFNPQIVQNQETKSLQCKLYIYSMIGIILAFMKLGGGSMLASIGSSEIINYLLLLCAAVCLNYCLIVFFVVFQTFTLISLFFYLGIQFQQLIILKKSELFNNDGKSIFRLIVLVISILFSFFLFYQVFIIYRIFKKIMISVYIN